MTPFFDPGPNPNGDPKIFLAGVGPLMTEVAGEVADGFICHGFTTEKFLREVTIPALERGRAKAGKTMDGFEIVGPSFVVTGNDQAELDKAAMGTRQQISFYGSTPSAVTASRSGSAKVRNRSAQGPRNWRQPSSSVVASHPTRTLAGE